MDVVDLIKCPFCGRWDRGIVRWDLGQGRICRHCDLELGPDMPRVQAARHSAGLAEWLAEYLAQYEINTTAMAIR